MRFVLRSNINFTQCAFLLASPSKKEKRNHIETFFEKHTILSISREMYASINLFLYTVVAAAVQIPYIANVTFVSPYLIIRLRLH